MGEKESQHDQKRFKVERETELKGSISDYAWAIARLTFDLPINWVFRVLTKMRQNYSSKAGGMDFPELETHACKGLMARESQQRFRHVEMLAESPK